MVAKPPVNRFKLARVLPHDGTEDDGEAGGEAGAIPLPEDSKDIASDFKAEVQRYAGISHTMKPWYVIIPSRHAYGKGPGGGGTSPRFLVPWDTTMGVALIFTATVRSAARP
tara:strand:+ start:112 stop:447 length:336 start_codon:yes stop_codon:yes gene_type:complete